MTQRLFIVLAALTLAVGGGVALQCNSQQSARPQADRPPLFDAIQDAQTARQVPVTRPEQKKSKHDRSDIFSEEQSPPSAPALDQQLDKGRFEGFDFYRDPLGADKPKRSFEAMMKADVDAKPKVMAQQRKLLEGRYNLKANLDPEAKMTRGKPLAVGPTARLAEGLTWDKLAEMKPEEIRSKSLFPYPSLPHPKHMPGGQVFPQMQIAMFPRLERIDVDFDLPEEFLPEFPPAIFLRQRLELGDVSRGEVVSINNFDRLFRGLITPVQLDGLRALVTPMPQEEFNPTEDRKSKNPSLGVACLDCHVNFHTTAQFHLNPDTRPQHRRFRLDTVSLRGVAHAQIHGSMRSLRSVEDFTEFEQRTAYFNGDPMHAIKKGLVELPRLTVTHMAQMQTMIAFPPAPKLDSFGKLIHAKASEAELRGEELFFGKARCAECHPPPFYIDNQHHDLDVERRFLHEPPLGELKTQFLRGIKESPPYLHDGRLLTLEDTVEFFNLVLELRLSAPEKKDIVAFMRAL